MKRIRILAALLAALPLLASAQAGPGYAFTDTGTFCRVAVVNNAGQVLGQCFTADLTAIHATHWDDTSTTDLGTLGGTYSDAFAINDAGQVVGYGREPRCMRDRPLPGDEFNAAYVSSGSKGTCRLAKLIAAKPTPKLRRRDVSDHGRRSA